MWIKDEFFSSLSSSPLIVSLFSLPKDRKIGAFTYYHITIDQSDLPGVLTADAEGPNALLGWPQEVVTFHFHISKYPRN